MKIQDVWDVWTTPYIWTKIRQLTGYEELDPVEMGLEYANRSGEKTTTPLLERVTDPDTIATLLFNRYKTNWEHYHALLLCVYNPIHNYDRSFSRTEENTHNGTTQSNATVTRKGETVEAPGVTESVKTSDTITTDKTDTVTPTGKTIIEEDTYAFDSSGATPSSRTTTTAGVVESTKSTGTDKTTAEEIRTKTGTDKTSTTGSDTTAQTGSEDTMSHSTIKETTSGNIGVTTTQQMMESEVRFWNEIFDFRDLVMKDVDKMLTLKVWD